MIAKLGVRNFLWQTHREIQGGNLLSLVGRFGDVLLVTLVVFIVGMMLVPLPTWLLDLLLTLNITLAVTILMVAMYIANPSQLASFPTILLITTLYRLALNISSTRLILLQAYAGQVILAFGSFVAGGNIVVGIVIFLILTLIQFIVITKGAERVAEVAARFTLDALPGKQMSIDADLRSGIIDVPEARKRRFSLQRESQLYGAMDGAMKFVKGDAIAGIVITLINIVGGLLIGVSMRGMEVGEAAQIYTLLTIGDGLVSQIPSLLISVSAGMVTTRVASEESDSNLGRDVTTQILSQPKAIAIVGGLLFVLGIIPGLPTIPFFALAGLTGLLAFGLLKARRIEDAETRQRESEQKFLEAPEVTLTVPIVIEVGSGLVPQIDQEGRPGRQFFENLSQIRNSLYLETGIVYPSIQVRTEMRQDPDFYRIWLYEVPLSSGTFPAGKCLVNAPASKISIYGLAGEDTRNPADDKPAAWIPAEHADQAAVSGLQVWQPSDLLLMILTRTLRRHGRDFIGIQEVQMMLENAARYYPRLVEEVVPKMVSIQQLVEILRHLADEEVSIRDLKAILECLAKWSRIEQDTIALTEQIRKQLSRQMIYQITAGKPTLFVYQLEPELEEKIRSAVRNTSTGSYLMLDQGDRHAIHQAAYRQFGELPETAQRPVLLTEDDTRRYVRLLFDRAFPELLVLSYQELIPDITVHPLGFVTVDDRKVQTPPDGGAAEEAD